jgi:hypothetical protein
MKRKRNSSGSGAALGSKSASPRRLKRKVKAASTERTPQRPSLTRTASTASAGSAKSGVTTRSGRQVITPLKLRFEDETEPKEEERAPTPQVPPTDEEEPTPDEPTPKFASVELWVTHYISVVEALNRELSTPGYASADAVKLLRKMLSGSYRNMRKQWDKITTDNVDELAEAEEANDAAKPASACNNVAQALTFLQRDFVSKATTAFSSKGLADLGQAEAEDALRCKYPDRVENLTEDVVKGWDTGEKPEDFTAKEIEGVLKKKKKGSGADENGMSYDLLKLVARLYGGCDIFVPLVNGIAQGRFNKSDEAVAALTVLRGIALKKGSSGDSTKIRPIGIGVVFTAITSSLLGKRYAQRLKAVAGERQYAVGLSGGVEAAGLYAQAALDKYGVFGSLDAVNAFNSVHRQNCLEAFNKVDEIKAFTNLTYGRKRLINFKVPGSDRVITITPTEGVNQGCGIAMQGYSCAQSMAIEGFSDEVEADDGNHIAFADDHGLSGKVESIIASSKRLEQIMLEKAGVKMGRLEIYKTELTESEREALSEVDAAIKEEGLVFVGTPVGTDAFKRAFANERADALIELLCFAEEVARLDPAQGRQLVVRWLRCTIGPTFNHVCQNVPPDLAREAATKLDDAVVSTVIRLAGLAEYWLIASAEERQRARMLIQLPIKLGGLGFHSQVILLEAAYVGAIARALSTVTARVSGLGLELPGPEEDLPSFLAHYEKAVAALALRVPATLIQKLDARKLWDSPVHGLQHELAEALHKHERGRVVELLPLGVTLDARGVRNHALAQASADDTEASAWVTAHPLRHKIHDGVYQQSVRARLLLPLAATEAGQMCAACKAPVDRFGEHALCCDATSARSNRHTGVQNAAAPLLRAGSSVTVRVPVVAQYYNKKPEAPGVRVDNTESKADIGINIKNSNANGNLLLVDFMCGATTKGAAPRVPYKPGDVAREAEQDKLDHYTKRWVFPKGSIIGFGIETSGVLGPEAKCLLWKAAKAAGGTQHVIAARYRRTAEDISVALQASRAHSFRRYAAVCLAR